MPVENIEKINGSCSSCGRPQNRAPITFKSLFSDGINVVFNLEKGFLFTIKELLVHPGEALENYLEGHRRFRYYNPFRFAFIMVTLSIIAFVSLGLYEASIELLSLNAEQNAQAKESIEFMSKYGNLVALTMVPFVALGTWIVFRKRNLAEHLVANFFSFGFVSFVGILLAPIYYFWHSALLYQQGISLLILLAYTIYFFHSYFKGNVLISSLKALLGIIIGIAIFIIASIPVNYLIAYLSRG